MSSKTSVWAMSQPLETIRAPGYAHLAEVSGGRTVDLSGQIAIDGEGVVVGQDEFSDEAIAAAP